MTRKPDGYYTVLVAGALARLRNAGNQQPTADDVVQELVQLNLLDPQDAAGANRIRHRFSAPVLRRIDRALGGITWKWEDT